MEMRALETLSFTQSLSKAVDNISRFNGRSRRSEFWWPMFVVIVASLFFHVIGLINVHSHHSAHVQAAPRCRQKWLVVGRRGHYQSRFLYFLLYASLATELSFGRSTVCFRLFVVQLQ